MFECSNGWARRGVPARSKFCPGSSSPRASGHPASNQGIAGSVLSLVFSKRDSTKDRFETGLFKMPISCECITDPFILHHHERNAICERPIFVWSFAKTLDTTIEKLRS